MLVTSSSFSVFSNLEGEFSDLPGLSFSDLYFLCSVCVFLTFVAQLVVKKCARPSFVSSIYGAVSTVLGLSIG